MSSVQSTKGHPDVSSFIFGQCIAVWDDDRNGSGDIYGQNIQLDGSLGSIPALLSANFTVSSDSICKDEPVQFTDLSYGNPTSWNWSFEGGTPEISTDQNPIVTYSTSGNYDVELTISDGTSSNTLLRPDYIFVDECTMVEDLTFEITQIFPVPASELINVCTNFKRSSEVEVRVMDITGRVIILNNMEIDNHGMIKLNISSLNYGAYVIEISNADFIKMTKQFLVN
jgi:PKD repeat protein